MEKQYMTTAVVTAYDYSLMISPGLETLNIGQKTCIIKWRYVFNNNGVSARDVSALICSLEDIYVVISR